MLIQQYTLKKESRITSERSPTNHAYVYGSFGQRPVLSLVAFTTVAALFTLPIEAASDAAAEVRHADVAVASAFARDVPLLAPRTFSDVAREYRAAESALKNKQEAQAVAASGRVLKLLNKAESVATQTRELLKDTVNLRTSILDLEKSLLSRLTPADEMLKQAAASSEAGDKNKALETAAKASDAYANTAREYLKQQWLPNLKKQIKEIPGAPSDKLARAVAQLDEGESSIGSAKPKDLFATFGKLKAIDQLVYPPSFRAPPSNLHMADFVLRVIHYDTLRWDFLHNVIVHASGTAWLVFQCQPNLPRPPLWQVTTIDKNMRVVEAVKNPAEEITLADAKRIDPAVTLSSTITMKLPAYAKSASEISQAVQQQIQWLLRPAGAIQVHFDDLTIQANTGHVLAGTAAYPTTPPDPSDGSLAIAGFRLLLHTISLTPANASVDAELEMPTSIVDPGTGHSGRVNLGTFPITSSCIFRTELPQLAYGPWTIGNTGMQIKGTGIVADFDPTWVSPTAPAGSAATVPNWRGAVLGQGATLPAAPVVVSNSGYLSASYSYPIALVAAAGLSGQFTLAAPYEFESLEPLGYRVFLSTGHLDLDNSAVKDGQFDKDKLRLPPKAAVNSTGGTVTASHEQLKLDANLILVSQATLSGPIRWGEFTSHPASSFTFYELSEAQGFKFGSFCLSGTPRTNYFPLNAADHFVDPNPSQMGLPALPGLTLFLGLSVRLQVDTPDTPTPSPLTFIRTSDAMDWINVSSGGVHGRLDHFLSTANSNTELGPVYQAFYQGQKPFEPGLRSGANQKLDKRYSLAVKFVSSSVFDANMQGAVNLPQPVNSNLDFSQMEFTSTAQISGAKLPMNNPLPLSYWGLDVVKKPGATSGGVISVRTGQVFFTAAGIRELRHFAMPFYLIWGDLLASGAVQRLDFDYNGAGQTFDRFGYTTSFVKLSDYDPNNPNNQAYLKTAGTVAFDVFGAKYLNINDANAPTMTGDPYDSRSVTLAMDSDPNGLYSATDKSLNADWGNGFGTLAYTYDYDINAQDGFVGKGTVGLQWVDQNLQSSIVLKAERICILANDTTRHDVTLGPIAHFGAMDRITGCGCIVNHQLERMFLSAELESTTDANIALRSATYGEVQILFTPSVSSIEFLGDMYLTILFGGNVEVQGDAKFTINRDQDFVEGDVDGHFDAATALGINSVSGDGHINWHIGILDGTGYQSLQGQLALSVVTPVAGTSAEGGLYIGINAPKDEAWVLSAADPHFKVDTTHLPGRLTGLYGYVKASESVNFYVLSGGFEEFVGLGGFVLTPQQASNLNAQATLNLVGLPYVIGNVGAHAWGEILGGLVSADGWADLQLILGPPPAPFEFQGTIDLSACVVWVACGDVSVTIGLNSSQGFYLN